MRARTRFHIIYNRRKPTTMHKGYIPFLAMTLLALSSTAQVQTDDTLEQFNDTILPTDTAELSTGTAWLQADSTGLAIGDTIVKTSDAALTVTTVKWRSKVDTIALRYGRQMTDLITRRQARLQTPTSSVRPNAYSLRMILPPTFYSSSVLQQFSTSRATSLSDTRLMGMYMVNDAFANMYVRKPGLVELTDAQIQQAGTLRDDVHHPLTTETKLSDKVVTVNLDKEMNENVELVTRKPNFWVFPGKGELKFNQHYFSEHWYKGGENFYSLMALLTQKANYNNRQKLTWDNTLEVQLGFQTTGKADKVHSLKPTNNLLRLTTKVGYKAFKSFYYTTTVQAWTQMVPAYDHNSNNLYAAIFSPLDMTVSVGLEYRFASKGNKFNGSLNLSPCAYTMRYVKHDHLVTRYGIEAGKHSFHKFGPNGTLEHRWQIAKNISWHGKLNWVTNYSYTLFDWENTFSFKINKYLEATLWMKPRFDDSSKNYKGDHGYFMMEEWFALGFSQSW